MLNDFKLEMLKEMNIDSLNELAKECREEIIKTVASNGGHLSSNLGTVELTIALHKVFNSPTDKILFDVSHQAYTHKLLTNRFEKFNTLRTFEGLSGFTRRDESIHDAYDGGHSSTSIAYGIGLLEAKKANSNIGEVITIIGDGALTNGLALSSINQLASMNEKMIVILNDNGMSVSRNVGALSKGYNSLRAFKPLKLLHKIMPKKVKRLFQYTFYKKNMFTSLGFKYLENIDGHNFKELLKYFDYAKRSTRSVVLHVKTKKGYGFLPALNDNVGKWHSVSGFNLTTNEFKQNSEQTFGFNACEYLCKLAKLDEQNVLRIVSPAMGLGCGLEKFMNEHPSKFIDCGIAEENAITIASSMAQNGLTPFVFMYASFMERAYDELLIEVARAKAHVVILEDHADIVAFDGDTHQGIYDLSYLLNIPGLEIFAPSSKEDLYKVLNYSLNSKNPIVIRYPQGECNDCGSFIKDDLSWMEVITNNEKYVVTYGPNVLKVKNFIQENNLNVGLIAANNLTNIDLNLLQKLDKKELIIYENVIQSGSLFEKLCLLKVINNLDIKLQGINIKDGYLQVGSAEDLKNFYNVSLNDLKNIL